MVNLRILRGPLSEGQNRSILDQYNQMTSSNIPIEEFLRWVRDSPDGPAWHGLLETEDGEIVGHSSLIPLRAMYRGAAMPAAKAEYLFVREDFRACQIQGFEKSSRPRFLILVSELLQHVARLGWGPFLISTTSALHRLGPRVGCFPVDFSLRECLLLLRPIAAARQTPNLQWWQRAALLPAGLFHNVLSRTALSHDASAESDPITSLDRAVCDRDSSGALSFFGDEASLRWRYIEGQYDRFSMDGSRRNFVVVKRGSSNRYLRVCQWDLDSGAAARIDSVVKKITRAARAQNALGVRWAVYGSDALTESLVSRLRAMGFLCVPRVRTELIYSSSQELRNAEAWKMNDALFSFDP